MKGEGGMGRGRERKLERGWRKEREGSTWIRSLSTGPRVPSYATAYNAASWLLTGVDVARVGVSVAAARHAARARSVARRVAVMSGVAALAELARVAGRAPALLHVQRRRTAVVVVAAPPSHGRRQRHVVDETETCRRTTKAVADYPLGRIGSCLRPGMVRGPGPFVVNFFYT